MKQLTDEVFAQVREALAMNRVMGRDSDGNYTRDCTPKKITAALAALDTAPPVPEVNSMLVELLEPAFTEIQHVLGSTLEHPFQRKSLEIALEFVRTALTAAKQAQVNSDAETEAIKRFGHTERAEAFVAGWAAAQQAQPERAPLSDEQKCILFGSVEQVKDGNELDYYLLGFEAAEQLHGIKQGGQHD